MSIVTFYSYKGGVGRSLALANVAVHLARTGKKVLVIDWDLEAPGLEEYFDDFKVDADGRGLLFLLKERGNLADNIWHLESTRDDVHLDLLPSGRDESDYYPTLERFDMDDFFAEGGGDFLEALREEWQKTYDHVLIDSRTGLSDAGGICTILLPDIVVGMFTATRQSVRGVRDVLNLAQHARQNIAYTRPQFSVIPVACRLNSADEIELNKWFDEFTASMDGLTEDWRPSDITAYQVTHALGVGHDDRLVHGTKIIHSDSFEATPQPYAVYKRIAALIDTDLSDMSLIRDIPTAEFVHPNAISNIASAQALVTTNPKTEKFKYHVFYSMAGGSVESRWVEEHFDEPFRRYLEIELGSEVRVFWDRYEISSSQKLSNALDEGIKASATMVAFLSHRSLRSEWATREMLQFLEFHNSKTFFPVKLGSIERDELPIHIARLQLADLSSYVTTGSNFQSTKLADSLELEICKIARSVAEMIQRLTLGSAET